MPGSKESQNRHRTLNSDDEDAEVMVNIGTNYIGKKTDKVLQRKFRVLGSNLKCTSLRILGLLLRHKLERQGTNRW